MAKQTANFLDRHAEKAVLAVTIVVLMGAIAMIVRQDLLTVPFRSSDGREEERGPKALEVAILKEARELQRRFDNHQWPARDAKNNVPFIEKQQRDPDIPTAVRSIVPFQPEMKKLRLEGIDPDDRVPEFGSLEPVDVVAPENLRVRVGASICEVPVKASAEEKTKYNEGTLGEEENKRVNKKKNPRNRLGRGSRFTPYTGGSGIGGARRGGRGIGGRRPGAVGGRRRGAAGRRRRPGGVGQRPGGAGGAGGASPFMDGPGGMAGMGGPPALRGMGSSRFGGRRNLGNPFSKVAQEFMKEFDIEDLYGKSEEEEEEDDVDLFFRKRKDVAWATVGALVDISRQREFFRDQGYPKARSQVLYTRVELQRQEVFYDGTFGPEESVPPVQNWEFEDAPIWSGDPSPKLAPDLANWADVGEPKDSESYYFRLKASQEHVMQPLLYDVLGGNFWMPPDMRDVVKDIAEKELDDYRKGQASEEEREKAEYWKGEDESIEIAIFRERLLALNRLQEMLSKFEEVDKQNVSLERAIRNDERTFRKLQDVIHSVIRDEEIDVLDDEEDEDLDKETEAQNERKLISDPREKGKGKGKGKSSGGFSAGMDPSMMMMMGGPEGAMGPGMPPGLISQRGARRKRKKRKKRAPQMQQFQGMDPGGMGGPPGMFGPGGMPGANVRAKAGSSIPDILSGDVAVVWTHDDSVTPGRTYRWRMRVYLYNRLLGAKEVVINDADAFVTELPSKWSEWSGPVAVPPDTIFFLDDEGGPDRAARVEVLRRFDGSWKTDRYTVAPGEPIGALKTVKSTSGPRGNRESKEVDFRTGMVALDVQHELIRYEIQGAGQSGLALRPMTQSKLIYMDESGQVFSKTMQESVESAQKYRIMKEMLAQKKRGRSERRKKRGPAGRPGMRPGMRPGRGGPGGMGGPEGMF